MSIRDLFTTFTSRVVIAPTHVGLNTNESSSPTTRLGTNPCARAFNTRTFFSLPLSEHAMLSTCCRVSRASNRNVTSACECGMT